MSSTDSLIDVHGKPITNGDLKRAMRINIAAGSLGMIWLQMSVGMPLTMFLEAVGASGKVIGALTTVRLLALVATIPGAFFSECLNSRKRFWAPMAMAHRALWFVVALIAIFAVPSQPLIPLAAVMVVCMSDILGNLGAPSWLSWMADLVPTKTSGRFWGVRQSIVTGVSLVGMGLAGVILDLFRSAATGTVEMTGFVVVFLIAAVVGVADIVVHLGVKEPRPVPAERTAPFFDRLLAPMKLREFRLLTMAMAVWSFSAGGIGQFWMVYLKRDFAVSYSHISAIAIAGSIGAVFSGYFFGHLIDRLGARTFCAMMIIIAPFIGFVWFFVNKGWVHVGPIWLPQVVLLLIIATVINGSFFSAVGLCQMRLLGVLAPASGRTMAMAMHWATIGVTAASAPYLGGLVMDWFVKNPMNFTIPGGIPFSFYHALFLFHVVLAWAVALPLILLIRAPKQELPLGRAVVEMVMTNPLQVVRNIYNMRIIAARSSRDQTAEAARKLGVSRTEMAVPDLIEKLEDPSFRVQEEAIEALGTIGSATAVEALVHKLEDPDDHLSPQIARALRHAGNPIAADALIKQLHSDDRETLTEAVRALGVIGDRRAVPHLLELVKNPRDPKVLAAAGEALASLEEVNAAWQLIPQMRALPNRLLKRALAVAIGDLLGEREGYYKVLVMENHAAQSGMDHVLDSLERALRRSSPQAIGETEDLLELRAACLKSDIEGAARLLLVLGLRLIHSISGIIPAPATAADTIEHLVAKDPRLALTAWLLSLLAEPWPSANGDLRDKNDLLLGIYLVAFVAEHGVNGASR